MIPIHPAISVWNHVYALPAYIPAPWFPLGLITIVVGGLEFAFGRRRTIAAVVIGFGMGLATPRLMSFLS